MTSRLKFIRRQRGTNNKRVFKYIKYPNIPLSIDDIYAITVDGDRLDLLAHQFYGDVMGVRIARKHAAWYLEHHDKDRQFRRVFNAIEAETDQLEAIENYFLLLQREDSNPVSPAA